MSSSLRNSISVSGLYDSNDNCGNKASIRGYRIVGALQIADSRSKEFPGQALDVSDQKGLRNWDVKAPVYNPVKAPVNKSLRWWEKNLKPNMIEINSAQELVDSLLSAGDKLVIVDFFSPGCGGCKALHPKICQLAESNPNAIFLTVNNEELRPMSSALRVHVIPFFRFYRGAAGRLCSFSCTTATIKKFKDAVEKYSAEEYGIGPAKGLEDYELLALASIGEISRKKIDDDDEGKDLAFDGLDFSSSVAKYEDNKRGNAVVLV